MIYWAIPFFLVTMLLEFALLRQRSDLAGYTSKDAVASVSMGLGNVIISAAVRVVVFAFFLLLWEHRLFTLDDSAWWFFPALIVLEGVPMLSRRLAGSRDFRNFRSSVAWPAMRPPPVSP